MATGSRKLASASRRLPACSCREGEEPGQLGQEVYPELFEEFEPEELLNT